MELIAGSKLCGMCMFFSLFRNVVDIKALVPHGNVIFKKLCISKRLCFMLDFHIHKFDRQVKYMCACAYGEDFLHACIDKDYRIITLRCGSYTSLSAQAFDLTHVVATIHHTLICPFFLKK